VGIVSLIVGMAGLATTLPKINDEFRPDHRNKAVIEPGESIEVNLTGLRVYSFFQNITDSDEIDGAITVISNGKEIELREPSIMYGLELKFDNNIVFKSMGWIEPSEYSIMELTSESNLTIYLVDQNEVPEVAITQPAILTSCLSLLLGGCLLPVSLVLFLIRKKGGASKSNVTLRTADGREVKLSIDGPTSSGAVLTTDQIYAIAKLQEKAGPNGEITLDFKMVPKSSKQSTPPPFADRPDYDDIRAMDNEEEKAEALLSKIDNLMENISEDDSDEDDNTESNWKNWDEG
jgi:hypothetical protein